MSTGRKANRLFQGVHSYWEPQKLLGPLLKGLLHFPGPCRSETGVKSGVNTHQMSSSTSDPEKRAPLFWVATCKKLSPPPRRCLGKYPKRKTGSTAWCHPSRPSTGRPGGPGTSSGATSGRSPLRPTPPGRRKPLKPKEDIRGNHCITTLNGSR